MNVHECLLNIYKPTYNIYTYIYTYIITYIYIYIIYMIKLIDIITHDNKIKIITDITTNYFYIYGFNLYNLPYFFPTILHDIT